MLPVNLLGITSITSHVRNIELNASWQMRSNRLTAKDTPQSNERSEPMTQHERMVDFMRESHEDNRRAMAVLSLEGRLMSGGRLSSDEMSFLRQNAPHLYEKAVKVAQERREFERELSQARSKQDVANMHQRRMSQFANEASEVIRSGKPRAERDSAMRAIHMRMAAVQNEYIRFTQSAQFQALPDEGEDEGKTITVTLTRDEEYEERPRFDIEL
ncbi:MAG: hypothetical protein FWB96_10875 [Defluviitaleaceae bacterium]|nr:hypothetical protein [Defluviitaleaceae bacterium]MCL2263464.1 hypothetical protein [Defluviitaleaceae bacterium]